MLINIFIILMKLLVENYVPVDGEDIEKKIKRQEKI